MLDYDFPFRVLCSGIFMEKHLIGKANEKDYNRIKAFAQEIEELSQGYIPFYEEVMFGEFVKILENNDRGSIKDNVRLQLHLFSRDLHSFREFSRDRQEEISEDCSDLYNILIDLLVVD